MGFATAYLEKHQLIKFDISEAPSGLLCYIVIIPAYREPNVTKTLESLKNCKQINAFTEVYVLFNYPEDDQNTNKTATIQQCKETSKWCNNNETDKLKYTALLSPDLPKKFAGVGYARKILMDLAVQRFNSVNNPDGVILSLDADTLVPENYLSELDLKNKETPLTNCFIFNFDHPIDGTEYLPDVYLASALYELHLRYYKQILQSTGFPYYQYTIGSCFAVRASVYTKVGGMNRRKAGEDFYFLQKVFMHSSVDFIKNIILQPSSRRSDRVPFGTGAAINKIVGSNLPDYSTYHPDLFTYLTFLFELVPRLYQLNIQDIENQINSLPEILVSFLKKNDYLENIQLAIQNTAGIQSFTKRFYGWFDAFKVMKFLNFARESAEYQIGICAAVNKYLEKKEPLEVLDLLQVLREIDLKE
jgi:hypothetical protein